MAWSSVGTVGTLNTNTSTAASFTWAPGAVGNAMFLEVRLPSTGNSVTSISSSNATWTQVASFSGTTNANKVYLYQGVASSTSSATVSLVLAGSPGTNTIRSGRQEFHSSIGAAPLVIATSHLDSSGTNTWPTVAGSGLYFGWAYNTGTAVNGSTSGFTYQQDSNGNSLVYNTSATSSSAPVFGDSTQAIGIMAIVTEAVSVTKGTADEVSATSGVASSTTSISPPAGSMVRWCVAWLNSNDTLGITFTAADSHGTSYGSPTIVPTSGPGDGDGGCYLMIWDHVYSSAPGATTLTVTASGTGVSTAAPSAMLILPYTITGQSTSPRGAFNSFNEVGTSTTTYEISLTTTAVGSAIFVLGAPNHNGGATGPVTPITSTVTDVDWDNATVGSRGTLGRGSSLTTTTGATTFGWTSANPSPNGYGVMAAEVLPAGAAVTVALASPDQVTVTAFSPVVSSSIALQAASSTESSVLAVPNVGIPLHLASSTETGYPFTTLSRIALPAASVTVTALSPGIPGTISLPAASVTVAGHSPSVTVAAGTNLTTAQENITARTLAPVFSGGITLPVARVTVTGYPLATTSSIALSSASVTQNARTPSIPRSFTLTTTHSTVTAHQLTVASTLPVIVNLRTATSHVVANPILYTPPVLVYLSVARARQSGNRAGPPNPLLMTVTPGSGTDDYGNAYSAGFHIYSGTTNGSRVSLQSTNDTYGALPTITYTPPSVSNVTLTPQSFGMVNSAGASNQAMFMIHTSGKTNGKDDAAIQLIGAAGDNSSGAQIIFEFGGSISMTISKTVIVADIPFNSIPMTKGPPSILPDTNKGQLYTDSSGALIYYSPGGTATIVVAGP